MSIKDLELNEELFLRLLTKLIGEAEHLQNNPPELVPEEDRAVQHVLEILKPLSIEKGGPLVLNHVSFVEGRGNLIVEYPGSEPGKIVSFVGSHLDVVTADREHWVFDPFTLTIEGDELRGRGTTDCLGHVALITDLMRQLGETKPHLKQTVVAVFIANEENSSVIDIGVDALVKRGLLDKLKAGPLFWIDVADKQPCIGTAGMAVWKLHVTGKLFHSGLSNQAINALELGMEALKVIQTRFYEDFPAHPKESLYNFSTPSTMKPTQWSYPGGGVNQIPGKCTISGDCRITPFYDVAEVIKKINSYVDEINKKIDKLDTRGPVSKYILPGKGAKGAGSEDLKGRIDIEFEDSYKSGIACSLDSDGYHALSKATEEVLGFVEPYSLTGSLPLVHELQVEGFDVQAAGYGLMKTYHAENEYCLLSDFKQGFQILRNVIFLLESPKVFPK